MQYLTNNRLFSVTISQDDIAKIIQKLDSGNAHGHDNFSIRMLKICGSAIYKPLGIIFKQFVNTGVFPSEWKKGNIVFICKKDEKLKNWKQTLKNYFPVSLLPICGKILERLMFNVMFKFFYSKRTYLVKPAWFYTRWLLRKSPSVHHTWDKSFDKVMRLRTSSKHLTEFGTMV